MNDGAKKYNWSPGLTVEITYNEKTMGFDSSVETFASLSKYGRGAARMQICPSVYVKIRISGKAGDVALIEWAGTESDRHAMARLDRKTTGSKTICFEEDETHEFGIVVQTVWVKTHAGDETAKASINVTVTEK